MRTDGSPPSPRPRHMPGQENGGQSPLNPGASEIPWWERQEFDAAAAAAAAHNIVGDGQPNDRATSPPAESPASGDWWEGWETDPAPPTDLNPPESVDGGTTAEHKVKQLTIGTAAATLGGNGQRDVSPNKVVGDRDPEYAWLDAHFAMASRPSSRTPYEGRDWQVRNGGYDAVLVQREGTTVTIGVADGVSQYVNGGVAAAAALVGVHEGSSNSGVLRLRRMLIGAWERVNECVNAAPDHRDGPATTIALADIEPAEDGLSATLRGVAEGDSKVLYWTPANRKIEQLTVDNAPPGDADTDSERYAALREKQMQQAELDRNPPSGISRLLAHSMYHDGIAWEPPIFEVTLPPGSLAIVVSDGMAKLKYSTMETVIEDLYRDGAAPTADEVREALLNRAMQNPDRGVDDDVTIGVAVVGSAA